VTSNGLYTPEQLLMTMPYAAALGVTLEQATPGTVLGRLAWSQERTTLGGGLHGGALMSLADAVGAVCAYLNMPEGVSTSTVESKTNFFRAVRDGVATAVAHPLHVGRTFVVVQTDVYDQQERRVSQTTQTQAVLDPAVPPSRA
jgi:1,4-dihydroxy-2-naphthoyl-CoA hydrolase